MPPAAKPTVETTVVIAAPPEHVYGLVADLDSYAAIADEVVVMQWCSGSVVCEGARFVGHNRNGESEWSTMCTVTEAAGGRAFAFDVEIDDGMPVAHWRWDFAPHGLSGTTVTHRTWDRRGPWLQKNAWKRSGTKDRAAANARHMHATLARLKATAERTLLTRGSGPGTSS